MITAQLEDGRTLQFPDGTDPGVIQSTVKRMIGGAVEQPEGEPATLGERALGALETAGTVASGIVAEPLAGLAGIGAGILPGGRTGAEAVESTREALTFMPRTEQGQQQLQAVAGAIEPIGRVVQAVEQGIGDVAFEATGSPAIAAAATALPTALSEFVGLASVRGGAKAAGKLRDIAKAVPDERISSILATGKKFKVPIFTTDLFPPESFIGKSLQSLNEKLGPLGTGTARTSQQRSRIAAVSGISENIDIDSPLADSIVSSLSRKNAERMKNAGKVRNEAISKLDEFDEFSSGKTISKIDELLQKQERLGTTANQTITKELNNFRQELSSPTDFSLKADQRTQLIKKIKAFERGEDQAPAAILKKVKSALDDDMVLFAKGKDRESAAKWLSSNRKFADELEKTKRTELKRILQGGEATPEKVIPILRGGKRSELQRLHGSLDAKGKVAAKSTLIQQSLKDAGFFKVDADPNPDAIATALNKPAFQQASKVFFKGKDKAELDGFIRMLDTTRRAQKGQVLLETSQQLLLPGGISAIGGAVGAGALPAVPTLGLVALASGVAKAYESKAFRSLLTRLSNTKRGSKIETQVLELASPFVVAELQAAKRGQQETIQ